MMPLQKPAAGHDRLLKRLGRWGGATLLLAAPALAVPQDRRGATAVDPAPAAPSPREAATRKDGVEYFERNERTDFDRRSATLARADLEELDRVSSLVEAASIDASEEDVEFKIAALFNAGG